MSLGLYPPDYVRGERHAVTLYGPPDHEGPPLPVWSAGLWSPNAEDLYEETDTEDGDDAVWGELGVETVNPSEPDT